MSQDRQPYFLKGTLREWHVFDALDSVPDSFVGNDDYWAVSHVGHGDEY